MSNLIVVPIDQLDHSEKPDFLFPAGPWMGTIDIVRSRSIPMFEGKPFAGYDSEEGELLSLQIGTNQALDGQVDIGATKFFVDIAVECGNDTLANIDTQIHSHPNWQLQQSVVTITQLAIALDAAEKVGENGSESWEVSEDFVDNLRAGVYDNVQVGFSVMHYTTKKTKKLKAKLESFQSAE